MSRGAELDEFDEDPRATLPCPLGLKSNGDEHDPKTDDGYLHQCACGAWLKGTLMELPALEENAPRKTVLVSDRQLLRLIQAGLRVPVDLREAVKRRLAGPA